jgi:hypothetical protein
MHFWSSSFLHYSTSWLPLLTCLLTILCYVAKWLAPRVPAHWPLLLAVLQHELATLLLVCKLLVFSHERRIVGDRIDIAVANNTLAVWVARPGMGVRVLSVGRLLRLRM